MSVDRGLTQFTANSELGTIDQNLFVNGTGVYIDQPAADIAPVSLLATNTYTGLYATDTFDITSKLSLTTGARFNIAQIDLQDETGADPLLNSDNHFHGINPVIGATYKFTSEPDRLCRLFRGEPGADAARARMLEPDQSLHHRQLPDRRSAAQAGGVAHLRGRTARQRSAPVRRPGN